MPWTSSESRSSLLTTILAASFLIGVALLAWRLSDLLLLAFGGVLAAVLLRHLAGLLHRWTELPAALSFAALLAMLESFQRLGYFVRVADVPAAVVAHVATASSLGAAVHVVSGSDDTSTAYAFRPWCGASSRWRNTTVRPTGWRCRCA